MNLDSNETVIDFHHIDVTFFSKQKNIFIVKLMFT